MNEEIRSGKDTSPIEWGVALQAFTGPLDESGDRYLVRPVTGGFLIAAVDGLGHGPRAAEVAQKAVAVLENCSTTSVEHIFKHCHDELRGTRGVVMSLARLNIGEGTMTWGGIGNVQGIVLRADAQAKRVSESLLLRGGVIGYHIPSPRTVTLPVVPGDTLIFATDGLCSSFSHELTEEMNFLHRSPQQIADHLLTRHKRGTDDAMALVVRLVDKTQPGAPSGRQGGGVPRLFPE